MSKLIIKNRYGITPNELLNNPKISIKAKGMFGYLQSKPDGWSFSEARIRKQMKEGRESLQNTLKELEKTGYLERKPIKDEKGKWAGYDYILYEKKQTDEQSAEEEPTNEQPVIPKTRITDNPATLSKKDYSKKDYSKKDYSNLQANACGKEINLLIDKFKPINPTYERLFANKTQRSALERMLKKFGFEKLGAMIDALPDIVCQKYAPRISTPMMLEDKLGQLLIFISQKKEERNTVIKT